MAAQHETSHDDTFEFDTGATHADSSWEVGRTQSLPTNVSSLFSTDSPTPSRKRFNRRDSMASIVSTLAEEDTTATDPIERLTTQVSRVLVINTGGTIGMADPDGKGYEPVPGFMEKYLKSLDICHDSTFDLEQFGPGLITRPWKNGKRIYYEILEYDPVLDSSDMMMSDWKLLAGDIELHYDDWDAFVILHGTDTMAYTASALSFMLENLGKSVVITGSQVPLCEQRSDGLLNFQGALVVAGNYIIPEVTLFFSSKLYRGNRVSKVNSMDFAAFDSPNFPPLVTFNINIEVNWALVLRPQDRTFSVQHEVDSNVAVIRIFPGITAATVTAVCKAPVKAVVLESFGAGNVPRRTDFLTALTQATKRGVIILNITQCPRGAVIDAYAAGRILKSCGVIAGGDMTLEAALAKLCYLVSKTNLSENQRKAMLEQDLRGEISSQNDTKRGLSDHAFLNKISKALKLKSRGDQDRLKTLLAPAVLMSAVATGNLELVTQLCEMGYDPNCADYDHRTPLHVAAKRGNTAIVRYLLSRGASVHSVDVDGSNPLFDAVMHQHPLVVRLLRDMNACLPTRRSAEQLNAACVLEDITMIKLWTLAGVDPNNKDYHNHSALELAWALDNAKITWLLLLNPKADRHAFLRSTWGLSYIRSRHMHPNIHFVPWSNVLLAPTLTFHYMYLFPGQTDAL
eukprot:m.203857 g.203857  ORF g.203857 m.203857 type:complete len:684 (+) comp32867_c0_seq1:366-2417(+)